MKILDKTWFNPGAGMPTIGIITVDFEDGSGIQQFIGTGHGSDEIKDAENIAHWGARFVAPRRPEDFTRRL